jgi:GTP-binding protein
MKEPLHGARFLLAETAHERLPVSETEVSFVGRSNVGKSSLICGLTNNWKLARVSKTPGATRAINVYEVKPNRWLVDLPGYGYAVGSVRARHYWPEMIGRYLTERSVMKRVYVLIDAEIGAGPIDTELVGWIKDKGIPFRLVATKADKIGRQKHATQRERIAKNLGVEPVDILFVSTKNNQGMMALQKDVVQELAI